MRSEQMGRERLFQHRKCQLTHAADRTEVPATSLLSVSTAVSGRRHDHGCIICHATGRKPHPRLEKSYILHSF